MKLLDKYILKNFIQNFLFGIFCFLIIFVIVDLFENLDRFIDKNVPVKIIIDYYIFFIPEILKLITPVGMLIASLFTISRFVNFSEFTAMKSAGISLFRYLMPILIFGIFITVLSIYFNGWIVPKTNTDKFIIERNYLDKNKILSNINNLNLQDASNKIITIGTVGENGNLCNNISIQIFNDSNLTQMTSRFDARQMIWDTVKKEWILKDYFKRIFSDNNLENLQFIKENRVSDIKEIIKLNVEPDIIIKKNMKPEELNLSDFKAFIENMEKSGIDVSKAKVDYYSTISFPFANLITIIFGVSVSTNRRRSGAAIQFGMAVLVSFIYLGFVKISQVFGYNGSIPPLLTAWIANIVFLIISVNNFIKFHRI